MTFLQPHLIGRLDLRLLNAGGIAQLTAGQAVWPTRCCSRDEVDLALHSEVFRERIVGGMFTLGCQMR